MSNYFCCPVCKKALERQEKTLKCKNNHSFDFAKSGYVNLLLSKDMNAKLPGDNKLMVLSRRDFLSKGYYKTFADALCRTADQYAKEKNLLLDAGCGEGYYTSKLTEFLKQKDLSVYGVDISKTALDLAAKREKSAHFAVASVFHLPFADHSADLLLSVFAPIAEQEFQRVLKKGGYLLIGAPGEKHLWELKQAVYETPYLNEPEIDAPEGFRLIEKITVRDKIMLPSKEDIQNLFSMTPYFYKTPEEGKARLFSLNSLTTQIEFEIKVFQSL